MCESLIASFCVSMKNAKMDQHHAPWRLESSSQCGRSLSPEIYESRALASIRSFSPKRLVLTACDFKFFERYCQNVIDYEKSCCNLIYVVGVFSTKKKSALIARKLYEFRASNRLKKFYPFVYGNTSLEWILEQQEDAEIQWDYKINYIRSSRFNLVRKVWEALGISVSNSTTIRDSSTYIIDFDNVIKGDFNHVVKTNYGDQSLLFAWESDKSASSNFLRHCLQALLIPIPLL